jgi:hypothetical protein
MPPGFMMSADVHWLRDPQPVSLADLHGEEVWELMFWS